VTNAQLHYAVIRHCQRKNIPSENPRFFCSYFLSPFNLCYDFLSSQVMRWISKSSPKANHSSALVPLCPHGTHLGNSCELFYKLRLQIRPSTTKSPLNFDALINPLLPSPSMDITHPSSMQRSMIHIGLGKNRKVLRQSSLRRGRSPSPPKSGCVKGAYMADHLSCPIPNIDRWA